MTPPLVSICMPNLNTRPFLAERMETILWQTCTDWELIVCDSHSSDGSWEFLEQFRDDPRVRLYQVPREGLFAGWNECLRRATGQYVYIATSDDTAAPRLLESLLRPLALHPEIDLAVCDFQEIDAEGRPLDRQQHIRGFYGEWMNKPCIRDGKAEYLLHCCFGPTWVTMTSVLFRRRLIQRGLYFRTDCGPVADDEWAMRSCLLSDVAYVPGRMATWRIHPSQASQPTLSRELLRPIVDCVESVLRDEQAGIPSEWKSIPHWDREIARLRRSQYYDSLGLFRGVAKARPRQFLGNVGQALRHEPWLLCRQVLNGFACPRERHYLDAAAVARELIGRFSASWPPRPAPDLIDGTPTAGTVPTPAPSC